MEVPGALGSASSSWERARTSAAPTGFEVHVSGRIESGQLTGVGDASCSYEVVMGPDWKLKHGVEDGETQAARNQVEASDRPSVVWNFPVETSLVTTNVSGWPRLAVSVRDGERTIVGYGSVALPTRGGVCTRYCRLFAPLSSSVVGDAVAALTTERPEFYDSRFTTACVGREALRVVSAGVVKISLTTRITGLSSLGYL